MQVYKFLDKNYDQVRQDVLDLFIQSKNKVSGGGVIKSTFVYSVMYSNSCEHCSFL